MQETESLYHIVSELSLSQVLSLFQEIETLTERVDKASSTFALCLDFKYQLINCLLKCWSLEKLSDMLHIFHPIECICI
jgi:hypothetical protein